MKILLCIVTMLLITCLGYSQVIEEWVKTYNGIGDSSDSPNDITVDDLGNVYVTGQSFISGTYDYATIKYNSSGDVQWVQTYNGPGNNGDFSRAIALDNSGNVYITGGSIGNVTLRDYATVKYNSDGVQQWVQRYNGPNNNEDYAFALAVDDAGNSYVTGRSVGSGNGDDCVTIKYNSAGNQQWVQRYSGPGDQEDFGNDIAVDDSGNVYVTGPSRVSGLDYDFVTIKYNPLGIQQWLKIYDGPGHFDDEPVSIAVDAFGNVCVTGKSRNDSDQDDDFLTVKYSSLGVQQWVQRFELGDATKIAVDNGGNVYVTGKSVDTSSHIYAGYTTIKYSSAGVQQWVQRYYGPQDGDNYCFALALDDLGDVYVTGLSREISTSTAYATIKYSSSGDQLWLQKYAEYDYDYGKAIAVDKSGNVFVTGRSGPILGPWDFATIKYSQSNALIPWGNSNGGSFSQGSNWVGGIVPDDEQTALFDTSYFETSANHFTSQSYQPLTITFDEITTTKGLRVLRSQIIFDLLQHSYGVDNLSIGGPTLDPIESQLEIINGAVGTTNTLSIAENGDQGQLIIGSGGILEFNPQSAGPILQIGVGGGCANGECGRLLIQDGGNLNSNSSGFGSTTIGVDGGGGAVFISGENSKWEDNTLVTVGENDGTGLLHIDNSGQFIGKSIWLAFLDNSHGEITVSDGSSAINLSEKMYLGLGANTEAHFTISNGATGILDKGIEIGGGSGDNDVTVTGFSSVGEPSTLAITDTIVIGGSGSGGMNVLNWGYLLTSTTIIPGRQAGIGSALVDGEGSEWRNAGTIKLGFEGVGFINVTDQGVLYTVGLDIGPLGSINGKNIYLGNLPLSSQEAKPINKESKLLFQLAIASIYIDTLLLSSGAQIMADSVIFGEGGYLGSEDTLFFDVINSGGINPGDSINTAGLLTINANYTQLANGTLFIELEGDLPGSGFDQLEVTGEVQLAGTLDVSVLNLFEPMVGQSFEIVTANNITGTFDQIITHHGLGVNIAYSSNNILITVTSPVSVDDNNNIIVPTEYSLKQNYPNPFNPSTTISFSIPEVSFVSLKIFNSLGEEVGTLVNEEKDRGVYTVKFDASQYSSGIYFYKLQAGNFIETKKMILLR